MIYPKQLPGLVSFRKILFAEVILNKFQGWCFWFVFQSREVDVDYRTTAPIKYCAKWSSWRDEKFNFILYPNVL